jgi:hypothetical protein
VKPRLLIVTEFNFDGSERVSRIEFWGLETYTAEEWTQAHSGGPWRATKNRVRRDSLDSGLKAYGGLVLERAILRRNAHLRGVAYASWVVGDASDKIIDNSCAVIERWIELGHHRPKRYYSVRNHCFLGCFYRDFPRGIMSNGCWGIQLGGLKTCRTCPAEENEKLCLGRQIRLTGKSIAGVEIPILAEKIKM